MSRSGCDHYSLSGQWVRVHLPIGERHPEVDAFLAEVIAKLKFIAAELQKAHRLETKREREQVAPEETR